MSDGNSTVREIDLGDKFGDVVVKANGTQVKISADGSLESLPAQANDTAAKPKTAPEIGAIESTGQHKGEIYGGILPADKKPIWFSRLAPRLMNHWAAAAWAEDQAGALPTREQGDYLDTIKDQGAFKTLFNGNGSFPAEHVWLAEPLIPYVSIYAWCQGLSDGDQYFHVTRNTKLPVLSVRR